MIVNVHFSNLWEALKKSLIDLTMSFETKYFTKVSSCENTVKLKELCFLISSRKFIPINKCQVSLTHNKITRSGGNYPLFISTHGIVQQDIYCNIWGHWTDPSINIDYKTIHNSPWTDDAHSSSGLSCGPNGLGEYLFIDLLSRITDEASIPFPGNADGMHWD